MRYFRTLFPGVFVLLLAANCLGAEGADQRLDKKMTLQAIGQPLESFAAALSMQSGITVKAAREIADYKVTVLAKDLPIGQLLSGVADALHIKQRSDGGGGTPAYEFYEDAASREKADKMYNDSRFGLRGQMDYAADALRLGLPDEELQKKADADPKLQAYIGDKDFRTAVEVYSKLPERDRKTLWEVGSVPVALDQIPEDTRKKVIGMFDANRKQREEMDKIELTDTAASVVFEMQDDPIAGRSLSFHIVGTGDHGITYMFVQLQEGGLDLTEIGAQGSTVYAIGQFGLKGELEAIGMKLVDGVDVDFVVVGIDRKFNYDMIVTAQNAIFRGAKFIAANPDTSFPLENGRVIAGNGALVAAIQAASGVAPIMIGKPETTGMHVILEQAHAAPEDTIVIGDRLDTDILAGNRIGAKTVLVLTGIATMADVEAADPEAKPQIIVNELPEMLEALGLHE